MHWTFVHHRYFQQISDDLNLPALPHPGLVASCLEVVIQAGYALVKADQTIGCVQTVPLEYWIPNLLHQRARSQVFQQHQKMSARVAWLLRLKHLATFGQVFPLQELQLQEAD